MKRLFLTSLFLIALFGFNSAIVGAHAVEHPSSVDNEHHDAGRNSGNADNGEQHNNNVDDKNANDSHEQSLHHDIDNGNVDDSHHDDDNVSQPNKED